MQESRIVILGGGFAGVKCARTLRRLLPKDCYKIVLFSRENHMVFSPLLAEVASAAIKTKDVAAPLRQLLKDVACRTEEVLNIDLHENFIEYESHDLTRKKMSYDQLVIACGNTSNLGVVPGMDEHAFPLKSVGDALRLQAHVIEQLEKAEVCEDPEIKKWYLTFTVIGGGFSGVEVAGELNDFVKASSRYYETIDAEAVNVHLVHSHAQILPEVSPTLRDFAKEKMENRGINFYLNERAEKATREGVWLKGGSFIPAATTVCTIGTIPLSIVSRLPVEHFNGRILTLPDMSIPGFPNAWSIGDCAAIRNAATGDFSPPVGQFAERQGQQVAKNIARKLQGSQTLPFSHKPQGQLCAIGGYSAVAEIGGARISGFPAWFLWRTIYLMKLPSLSQKLKVGIEWACDLLFPRDLGYVKTDQSRSATRAFYAPGDYIFRQGDPACDFYVIEHGEVDILVYNDDLKEEEVVAVLGPGDFFGEAALIKNRPRNASVRARDNVMVVVMGRRLFSEISSNLSPLRDAIAKAIRRRGNVWKDMPHVQEILDNLPLESLIEPVPGQILRPDDLLVGLLDQFRNHELDFCCVIDDAETLIGVVTRSDLLRTIEAASYLKGSQDEILRVQHIMGHEPVVIGTDVTTKVAVSTMREHGLKTIPVVDNAIDQHLVGCIRIETILGHIIEELTKKEAIRITEIDMVNPFSSRKS